MIHSRIDLHRIPKALAGCSVDPVTLSALALGGLAGGAASMIGGGSGAAPTPTAPTPPPTQQQAAPPVQQPQGQKNGMPPPSQQSTFLGTGAIPPVQSGQKSLLGQ